MIPRTAGPRLKSLSKKFPVVAVVGPRQSGKSTLVRKLFPHKPYATLEPLDVRAFAEQDPRGFLARYSRGAILDEVQRSPNLFSYLQEVVDEANKPGLFILTGSQHFLLMESISQSLAGRVAFLELLPFAYEELPPRLRPKTIEDALFKGGYPRLYDKGIDPADWYPAYLQTYVERDVRQIKNVTDLETFRRFVTLCAGRTGQILNYSSLASDAGISHPTAMAWISLLEASFIIQLLRPHHANFNKRLTKMPKLHFIDTGLVSSLLGIETASQLATHPLRGPLFESWIFGELLKRRLHRGQAPHIFYWRDQVGHELDLLIQHADKLYPCEVKSGKTFSSDMTTDLRYWSGLAKSKAGFGSVFYAGNTSYIQSGVHIRSWRNVNVPG